MKTFYAANQNWTVVPKNTNPNLCLSNPQSQICVLCQKSYKRTVYHYKTSHEHSEVFVSRLSPRMAEAARNGSISVKRCAKYSMKYLKTVCLFCEIEKEFSLYYWTQHIRSHTGEYANECLNCNKIVCFNTHCGKTTTKKDDFDLKISNLHAFICRECNYIQINKEKMLQHLKNEHEHAYEFKDLAHKYDKIIMLPSWFEKSDDERSEGIFQIFTYIFHSNIFCSAQIS